MPTDERDGSDDLLARVDAFLDGQQWRAYSDDNDDQQPPTPHLPRVETVRRAPPRRPGRPPKTWDEHAARDLFLDTPPGYIRDRRGRWRYEATGLPVPGARDITLDRLYDFPHDGGFVLVPAGLAREKDELDWCRKVDVGERAVVLDGHAREMLEVPLPEWEARQHAPLGLDAPELSPSRLLNLQAVAQLAGVSRATIASYSSRKQTGFPEPVARFTSVPVWSEPIIRHWLSTRPGHGGGGGGARQPRPKRRRPGRR